MDESIGVSTSDLREVREGSGGERK